MKKVNNLHVFKALCTPRRYQICRMCSSASPTIVHDTMNTILSSQAGTSKHRLHQSPIIHRGYDIVVNHRNGSSLDHTKKNSKKIIYNEKRPIMLSYFRGWAYQQVFLNRRIQYKRHVKEDEKSSNTIDKNEIDVDRILFLEHDHVYTLGRGADENYLTVLKEEDRHRLCRKRRDVGDGSRLYGDSLKQGLSLEKRLEMSFEEEVNSMVEPSPVLGPNNTPIYRIERGGEVTYHGPGQLVCYPLLDLTKNPYKKDLHWYLTCIEEVIIQTLDEIGIVGKRDDINTGVWVGKNKIAAVGVSSSRWITTHGFSLNINPDLTYFDTSKIIPCGIEGRGVTSISEVYQESSIGGSNEVPGMDRIVDIVIDKFENVFSVKVQNGGNLS